MTTTTSTQVLPTRRKVLAAVATVTVVGGVSTVASAPAKAATPEWVWGADFGPQG